MIKNQNILIKVSSPSWLIILFIPCLIIALPLSIFYTALVIYNNRLSVFGVFLLIFVLAGFWFIKLLFYSVTATESGLETTNLLGSNKSFIWEEIVKVRRPRFGIPYDFTYVVSKNKGKLLLVRSMQNYKELIELIKVRAPNLQKCKS